MRAIHRLPLVDEVVREIRRTIESGDYVIGAKFATERELSEQLSVGRSTVREALRVLEAHGLLEIKRGRGAFVRRTGEESQDAIRRWFAQHEFQLLDFMEVRSALEPLAVRLTVERADAADIAKIGDELASFEVALEAEDTVGLATHDEALHSAIAEASRNSLVKATDELLGEAFRAYRHRAFAVMENARNALEPHRRIVDAIRRRDAEAGVTEMLRHLEISRRDIHDVVAGAET